jgi:hypothetical protein
MMDYGEEEDEILLADSYHFRADFSDRMCIDQRLQAGQEIGEGQRFRSGHAIL